ncbi:MAG: hypothetical protein ACI808_000306 [Paraglaciecola sp.]|jgi:hypothetical protein
MLYHPVLSFSHLYPVPGTHLGEVFSTIDKAIPSVGESINHGISITKSGRLVRLELK